MTETTKVAAPADDQGAAAAVSSSGLNRALAWVGIIAGGVFVVGAIFLAGYFLNYSQHMHMAMGHAAASKDCCADMKPGDMKPGDIKPGMMGPHSGR